jgi:hypothetical protein
MQFKTFLRFVLIVTCAQAGSARADLVGLWRFDANVSPQPDSSTYGHDAELRNEVAWDASRGGSMKFDGDADFLEVADTDALSITGDMTISAWVNFATFDSWNSLVSKNGAAEKNKPAPYDLYTNRDGAGTPVMFIGDGAGSIGQVTGTASATLNEWQHIAVTITESGDITHYLNGGMNGSGNVAATRVDADTSLMIGHRADGALSMTGLMDDVAIFNQVLSEAEINTVMSGDFSAYGVPEPSGVLLLLAGMIGLSRLRRKA